MSLDGGNSNIFYFHPDPWGDDPIWRAYFWKGLVQPPTRSRFTIPKKVTNWIATNLATQVQRLSLSPMCLGSTGGNCDWGGPSSQDMEKWCFSLVFENPPVIPCVWRILEVWKEPLKAEPQEVFRGPNDIFSGGVWMSRVFVALRIMGSQNWWFRDPRNLRHTDSNPSIGGSNDS